MFSIGVATRQDMHDDGVKVNVKSGCRFKVFCVGVPQLQSLDVSYSYIEC